MKEFYGLATICYYRQGLNIKAFKTLRKITTNEDKNEWALIGTILKKVDDSGVYRNYYKRQLEKEDFQKNPFIVMLLANNYLQKS